MRHLLVYGNLLIGTTLLLFQVNASGNHPGWVRLALLIGCNFGGKPQRLSDNNRNATLLCLDGEELDVIVVKIGGSSLTDKAKKETIDHDALAWFSKTIFRSIHDGYTENSDSKTQQESSSSNRRKRAYVIVHGAGKLGL